MTGLQDILVAIIVGLVFFSLAKYLYYKYYKKVPAQSACCDTESNDCSSCTVISAVNEDLQP